MASFTLYGFHSTTIYQFVRQRILDGLKTTDFSQRAAFAKANNDPWQKSYARMLSGNLATSPSELIYLQAALPLLADERPFFDAPRVYLPSSVQQVTALSHRSLNEDLSIDHIEGSHWMIALPAGCVFGDTEITGMIVAWRTASDRQRLENELCQLDPEPAQEPEDAPFLWGEDPFPVSEDKELFIGASHGRNQHITITLNENLISRLATSESWEDMQQTPLNLDDDLGLVIEETALNSTQFDIAQFALRFLDCMQQPDACTDAGFIKMTRDRKTGLGRGHLFRLML